MEEIKRAGERVAYRGYWYKLSHIIEVLILGLLSRLQTLEDIHEWANSRYVKEMLRREFSIRKLPCYSHFTVLVGMIDSDELNKIFMEFFGKLVETVSGKTISFDGKTVCATANMEKYSSPLHIASAFVVENGITIGQLATEMKSNEIPAVQELLRLLNIKGATVVADALNCQKKTVAAVLEGGADYVFSVKKNQRNLYDDISEFIDFKRFDKVEAKKASLEKYSKTEKGHGRIEKRTAYVTQDVGWLLERENWAGLRSIGAVVTESETRYYISSHALSAEQLLYYTRAEWAVESMHWQLDVIFGEDRTTLNTANAQKTLNLLRKTALNITRIYRDKFEPKQSMTGIMRKCLFDPEFLLTLLRRLENVTVL